MSYNVLPLANSSTQARIWMPADHTTPTTTFKHHERTKMKQDMCKINTQEEVNRDVNRAIWKVCNTHYKENANL